MEAFWCMMAYFATFWWYGISLSAVWGSSNTYFQVCIGSCVLRCRIS